MDDDELAKVLRSVFEVDFDQRRRDSISEEVGAAAQVRASLPMSPQTSGGPSQIRRARLVIGPDANLDPDGILELLASARERLSIETFYIEDRWRDTTNPFLEGAFDAARGGVTVKILLYGTWSSLEADSGPYVGLVARINLRARENHLAKEATLFDTSG